MVLYHTAQACRLTNQLMTSRRSPPSTASGDIVALLLIYLILYSGSIHGNVGVAGVLGFAAIEIAGHHGSCSKTASKTAAWYPTAASSLNFQKDANAPQEEKVAASEKLTIFNPKRRRRIPVLSYKDNYVIVSKPAGMTMHHNSNSRWGRSKQPVLETIIKKQLSRKPFLVHRLDHRTSGALFLAFDSETAARLHGRLRQPDAIKLYVALVRGDLREKFKCAATRSSDDGSHDFDLSMRCSVGSVVGSRGKIPHLLSDDTTDNDSREIVYSRSEYNAKITVSLPIKIDKIDNIEKEAETDFYFLSAMNWDDESDENDSAEINKSLSLLLCRPKTGKIHQIRRHVARGLQSPIIGDSEHGDSRVNRFWREFGFNRLGLHCLYVELPGSDDEGGINCIAPLSEDFKGALQCDELSILWEEAVNVLPSLRIEPYDERGGTFGRHFSSRKQSENIS